MKLLVIGGTRFLGRHLVTAALTRGHAVTLFNRGRSGIAPAGAVHLQGDRDGDLSLLQRDWDAVVDTCAYRPREVRHLAQALRGRTRRYLLVSSISVYAGMATPRDEASPLATIDDPDTETIDGHSYGALKALCEQAAREAYGDAATLVLRPGLIVGPHDPTQRFTYWPARLARATDGEPVLAPGGPDDALQFIDVRDLAEFMLDALAAGLAGTFNTTSPPGRFSVGALLEACARAAGVRPRWQWADADALERLGLQGWSDLPVWVPLRGETAGMPFTSVAAATAAGLRCRPLAETVADTLAWWRSLPAAEQAITRAGLSAEREAAALAALAALQSPTGAEG